jgi:pantothenate kinase
MLDALVARITALVERDAGSRVLIGIAGAPGAGKSSLAAALTGRLAGTFPPMEAPVAHVPMDGFHLADAALDLLALRGRKGAPETFDAVGYAALLRRVAAGELVWAPSFERDLEQPLAQAIPVPVSARAVISEGNYLLLTAPEWQAVRAVFTEVWFCAVDDDVRRERLIRRHVEFGKTPEAARSWVAAVDDANARLVAATAGAADLVVDLTDASF